VLFVSLALSVVFLVIANYCARRPKLPVSELLVWGIALAALSYPGLLISPPVAIQFILVFPALLVWRWRSSSSKVFLTYSLLATAAAYGVAVCFSLSHLEEFARLRERFPVDSLEDRLPAPRLHSTASPLPVDTANRLTDLEAYVGNDPVRALMLHQLHATRVWLFVNSPGFGVARLPLAPNKYRLTGGLRDDSPIPQPVPSANPSGSTGDLSPGSGTVAQKDLQGLHLESIVDFAHSRGFGYVKDRRHVVGFQSHGFSQVPKAEEHWEVRRLELVGLLLHEEPVVYVSDNLPRMDELRGAPTRPLDSFEAAALEKIRAGQDLLLAEGPEVTRMLGAIRSVRQCVGCHGGERGDLLGAFSYTLRQGER
jgi:hypothetical protein